MINWPDSYGLPALVPDGYRRFHWVLTAETSPRDGRRATVSNVCDVPIGMYRSEVYDQLRQRVAEVLRTNDFGVLFLSIESEELCP